MSEQYSIGNKFDLVDRISLEPLGCYYKAKSLDGELHLLLLLNTEFSILARSKWELINSTINDQIRKLPATKKSSIILPITDCIDFIEGVAFIMPYTDVIGLSTFIDSSKGIKLSKIKQLLKGLTRELSTLHAENRFHGFINFSTTLIANKQKIVLAGGEFFAKIFNTLELPRTNTGLNNSRIRSCLSVNLDDNTITCSPYADYYSMFVIITSLLQGYISNDGIVNIKAINKNLSSKSKIYLTPTFCLKFYKARVPLYIWLDKLASTNLSLLRPVLTGVLSLFMLASSGLLLYKYWPESSGIPAPALVRTDLPAEIGPVDDFQISRLHRVNLNGAATDDLKFSPEIAKLDCAIPTGIKENKVIENSSQQEVAILPKIEIKTDVKQALAQSRNLKCHGDSCYNLISPGIKGPELAYSKFHPGNNLVMKQPISRNDYYVYCYIAKTCNLKSDFDEEVMTNCLFGHDCSKKLYAWLSQPMEFVSSHQVRKYIAWLNETTEANYDIISDQAWLAFATQLNAENNCKTSKDKTFKVYTQQEWVKLNNTLAFRTIKPLPDSGCQVTLDVADAENHVGTALVRLSRTA